MKRIDDACGNITQQDIFRPGQGAPAKALRAMTGLII